MLAESYQVTDVLLLVGNVAPVACYFLLLGLVNSHARPFLLTSRADFVALTSVLVPVLMWPLPAFAHSSVWWPMVAGLLMAVLLFLYLLPAARAGFVIYNISESRCTRLLQQALRGLSLEGRWEGSLWTADDGRLSIDVRHFALLRNVTIHTDARDSVAAGWVDKIGQEMERRLGAVSQLPSSSGVGLVLVGMALLILPLWMVGRHIQDLVDAMSHLFG